MQNNETVRQKFTTTCGHEQCERANQFGLEVLDLAFSKYPKMSLIDLVTVLMDLGQVLTSEAVKLQIGPDTSLEDSAVGNQPVGLQH